jgi:mediator of RNA polymerase II transcription subunit 12, fungi type
MSTSRWLARYDITKTFHFQGGLRIVVAQLIQNGLQRISDIIQDVSLTSDHNFAMGWVDHAGQILRILAHFAEPLRHESSQLPQLDSDAQDKFIGNLYDKFKALEAMQSQDSSARVAGLSIFLARVLQFDLAFIRAWTTKTIDTGVGLLTILFRLAMV